MRFWVVLLCSFFIMFVFCTKEPTEPGQENDQKATTGNSDYVILGSKVIGSKGGTMNFDSIAVEIPAGAFSEETKVEISASSVEKPFAENGKSDVFQIEGITRDIAQPIRIRIRKKNAANGDSLVAVGGMTYSPSLNDSLFTYTTASARDSADFLIYEIPAEPSLAKKNGSQSTVLVSNPIRILVLGGYSSLTSSNNHFEIFYPSIYRSEAEQLGQFFEAAYDTFENMGMSYSGRTWPAQVVVKEIDAIGYYSFYIPSYPTDEMIRENLDHGRFAVNTAYIQDRDELRVTAAHEFLHLVQNVYEFSEPKIEPEQIWLVEATAVWAEEKFTDKDPYVSSVLHNNEMEPLYGWQYASGYHGYGMSVLFTDLVDKYGDGFIVDVFEEIQKGTLPHNPVDPVDAVIRVLEEPVSQFWHGFLGAYLLGYYFDGEINSRVLENQNNYTGTFTIDDRSDTLKKFPGDYKDLSGKLFKIEPKSDNIDSSARLEFSLSDPEHCGLLVCKYKSGQKVQSLGDVFPGGDGSVIIENIPALQKDGWDLIAIVSNSRHELPYTSSRKVDLTVSLHMENSTEKHKPPELDMPPAVDIGYWNYVRFTETIEGDSDTLFTFSLKNPEKETEVYLQTPDGEWMPRLPIGSFWGDTRAMTGSTIDTFFPKLCPGESMTIRIRAENEFGADTVQTQINIGNIFDGIQINQDATTWRSNVLPNWVCYLDELEASAGGPTFTGNFEKAQYFCPWDTSAYDTSWTRSCSTNSSLTANGCTFSGRINLTYEDRSDKYQPGNRHFKAYFNLDNSTYETSLGRGRNDEYSFQIDFTDLQCNITEKFIYTYEKKPDSTEVNSYTAATNFVLTLQGDILY